MINNESELWQKRLNTIFKKKDQSDTDIFLSIVSMVLYNSESNEDIARLYSCTDLDTFLKVVALFESRTIEFPSKKEIREAIELSLFYYYRNVLGIKDYSKLKEMGIINEQDFSSISIGKRLSKLNKDIVKKLENMDQLFDSGENNE